MHALAPLVMSSFASPIWVPFSGVYFLALGANLVASGGFLRSFGAQRAHSTMGNEAPLLIPHGGMTSLATLVSIWGCPFGANWCPFGAFGGALGSKTRPWCHFGGLRALCVRPGGFQGSQKAPMGAYVGPKSVELGAMLAPKGSILGPPKVEPHLRNEKRYLKEGIYPFGVAFWDAVGAMLAVCGLQFACMLTTLSEPQAGGNHRCF